MKARLGRTSESAVECAEGTITRMAQTTRAKNGLLMVVGCMGCHGVGLAIFTAAKWPRALTLVAQQSLRRSLAEVTLAASLALVLFPSLPAQS